ncbi:glucose-6-phosphate dehydrogenase [Povalibacter sp.]|uniref:glucose-6-phosphate dehydrogenase n=1 Tax=Povalibacter sp. TaxID=1962978 RepID=UPI002F400364
MQQLATFDLVLFGGTGDLALRKLLPALYRRQLAGQLTEDSRIIGVARSDISREDYLAQVETSCRSHVGAEFDDKHWSQFARQVHYFKIDANAGTGFDALHACLKGREANVRPFFLSTAPSLFAPICEGLARTQLVTPASRVVLEKPLGHDRTSSALINERVGAIFSEQQIFRIDHYLGKETVQNLMALRFGNLLFEPLWKRGRVQHVQITVAENLGVERRAQFYDQTGALRDMVQNHLLQLLCIIAMEPPQTGDADAMRDEKLKVLRALRPLHGREVLTKTVRGQYKSGAVSGTPVVGYLAEKDVPPESVTETFMAVKCEIDSWRWAGVPFYLRTGKRLQEKMSEIAITFEDIPVSIYERPDKVHALNRLIIRLAPDESITLSVLAKSPGEGMRLKPVSLALDFNETFKTRMLDAYERLLTDVIKGNLTLFMRRDELDAAWQWIDPIREAWQRYDETPKSYSAGTWGPAAASALIGRDGFAWSNEL